MREPAAPPLPYRVVARNTASASANKIHDEVVAREYGFKGGLVPGAVVFEYICHPLAAAWGRSWLSSGTASVRFSNPIYDGDQLLVEPAPAEDGEASLKVLNPERLVCASGRAGFGSATTTLPLMSRYAEAPLPEPPPTASDEAFRSFDAMGSVDATLGFDEASDYLAAVGEDLPLYRKEGVVPPGHFLHSVNKLLSSNVRLGPWIHVSSELRLFGVASLEERLQVRGRVAGVFEKKGHRFVELDAMVVASGKRPVAHVRHTAIYEPARRGA